METLSFLIVFPLVISLILLLVTGKISRWIINISALIIGLASLSLIGLNLGTNGSLSIAITTEIINKLMLIVELCLAGFVLHVGIKHKSPWIIILDVLQVCLLLFFELVYAHGLHAHADLFIDRLSLIMALIIGVIGSLIAVYGGGYMQEFHEKHHPEMKDKRPLFFFTVFAFLGAMFGIVFSNNLMWLYFFWEITTICSFVLIGYKSTTESTNNSLRALTFNLIGGLAFVASLFFIKNITGGVELDILLNTHSGLVIIPAILLGVAGLTKAAQLPFSTWLLGAMVAPTPVSALLHSSTMVKAGVYLLVKLAPIFQNTITGNIVAMIGAVTFLITSFLAIAQNDSKKVLAYSTIANLGLIVTCAGIGTYEAVWAAIFLIIFHAIAKALLFLCVGIVEHKLHSRQIESMEGLIQAMPTLAWMMLIGMAGMFLAPFGMLISKWAALKALIDAHAIYVVPVIYGSAATLFFWVKWMGKILIVTETKTNIEKNISRSEMGVLFSIAGLTIAICLFFPIVSSQYIEPYVTGIYGIATRMSRGNILTMIIMLAMVILFPFSLPSKNDKSKGRNVGPYLSGANVATVANFTASMKTTTKRFNLSNYYMENYFGEKVLLKPSIYIGIALLIILLVLPLGGLR